MCPWEEAGALGIPQKLQAAKATAEGQGATVGLRQLPVHSRVGGRTRGFDAKPGQGDLKSTGLLGDCFLGRCPQLLRADPASPRGHTRPPSDSFILVRTPQWRRREQPLNIARHHLMLRGLMEGSQGPPLTQPASLHAGFRHPCLSALPPLPSRAQMFEAPCKCEI